MPELKAKMIGALNKLSPEPVMYKKIKETIEKYIKYTEEKEPVMLFLKTITDRYDKQASPYYAWGSSMNGVESVSIHIIRKSR